MSTANLGISHIAAAQNQPEVTANNAFDALDAAQNSLASIPMSDADYTMVQAQLASGQLIKMTGALTAIRHVNLPAGMARAFIFQNATTDNASPLGPAHNLVVQVSGSPVPGTTATLSAALGLVLLYSDGTNVTQLTSGSAVL